MPNLKILAFSGSLRKESWNQKLLNAAIEETRKLGVEVTAVKLIDFPMPFMNEDLEESEGLPPNAAKFRDLITNHNALLIASPEYNHSVTGVLKNAIDWCTRPPKNVLRHKPVLMIGTSPGAFGATRGLLHLRQVLSTVQAYVLPEMIPVPLAEEAFDASGKLVNEMTHKALASGAKALIEFTGKMAPVLERVSSETF